MALNRYRLYLLSWLPFWLAATWLVWQQGYKESFLSVYHWRQTWLDVVMPHFTHLGDGLIIAGLMGLVVRREPLAWWRLVLTIAIVGVLIPVAKTWIFADWARPIIVFLGQEEIGGLSLRPLFYQSFPSGHATAAAAATAIPAFSVGRQKPWLAVALALFAVLLAYSRVYIGVHFLADILVGSLLGVMIALVVEIGTRQWLPNRLARYSSETLIRLQSILAATVLILGIVRVGMAYY